MKKNPLKIKETDLADVSDIYYLFCVRGSRKGRRQVARLRGVGGQFLLKLVVVVTVDLRMLTFDLRMLTIDLRMWTINLQPA